MKRVLLSMALLFIGLSGRAQQLQNPNFENWTGVDTLWNGGLSYHIAGWSGGNLTTDSYTGTYAAKVEPFLSCGIAQGWMFYGAMDQNHFNPWAPDPDFTGSGAPSTARPDVVNGYFKFLSPYADDSARGIVVLKKWNAALQQSEEVGRGEIAFTTTSNYTPFSIIMTDLLPGVTPDSIVVAFSSGMGYDWNSETNSEVMGTLYIDQLRLQEGVAGVEEQSLLECRFFPNPSSGNLQYSFTSAVNDDFELIVTDAAGKIVFSEQTQPGEHSIDLGTLAPGAYYATIYGTNRIYASETIVVKE